jgi:hypothetical protein
MNSIYETIKTVNGHNIYRMKGTHGCYHVDIKVYSNHSKKFMTFNTIKAATAFCETL